MQRILAFLIHYGNPSIGEPLSCAWERLINTQFWKEYSDKWEAMELAHIGDEWKTQGEDTPPEWQFAFIDQAYRGTPYDRDDALIRGTCLRHELIARFSGATEKEKLERIFASAPPWLVWFTFADYTAELLGLPLPDLSSVKGFARSKVDFKNWYGLPRGAFEPRPWPHGHGDEPLAHTDLNLIRPAPLWPDNQITRREQRRALRFGARSAGMDSHLTGWPPLLPLELQSMPIHILMAHFRRRQGIDT